MRRRAQKRRKNMTKLTYTAPCHFGIEKTLSFEVKKIGGEDITVSDGRVTFTGPSELCAKANIFLSTAERVCVVLGKFRAKTFDELFEGIKALPLSDYIGRYDAFPNTGHSLNSVLKSVPACQKIVKKAMAVNLCRAYGLQTMPETGATAQIRFSIMKDEVTLMLDTSGAGLHKRGYRRDANAAPIKETLAAGIIDLARIRENDAVCDPFCGSGTLLIEAGLKALNIAPGLNRSFAAERLGFIPDKAWQAAREEAADLIKRDAQFRGFGFDADGECVSLTLSNAKKASPLMKITAERRDIKDYISPAEGLKIITNPPYGERMLEVEQAREIYRVMGEKLLPLDGAQLYVITPDEEFEDIFGQKADKNRKLYNGMLLCRLYSYFK